VAKREIIALKRRDQVERYARRSQFDRRAKEILLA
jgi:hypothetical protein